MEFFLFHTGRFYPLVRVRNNEKQTYLFGEHPDDCLGVLLLNTIIGFNFLAVFFIFVSPALNIAIITIVAIFPFFAIDIISFLTLSFMFICMAAAGGINR